MPELPESDMMRRVIERECLNRTIERITLGEDTGYIDLPGDTDRKRLKGRQFTQTWRHGKYIFRWQQDRALDGGASRHDREADRF